VNTSFNVRGEPIVCSPADAYRCFLATDMNGLVLENFLLRKERMKKTVTEAEKQNYLAQFELD
jgi:carbamoyltransferase